MRTEAQVRKRLEYLEGYLDGARDRLKAADDLILSPYFPESSSEAHETYTDELLTLIKAAEAGIYELELVLEEDEEEEPNANARSFEEIPDEFIDEVTRTAWIERVERGSRVYAYPSSTRHVWNIWDGHQRIELRRNKSGVLDSRIEAILNVYRTGGMTLEAFEARILDAIQATHTTPMRPATVEVEAEQPA